MLTTHYVHATLTTVAADTDTLPRHANDMLMTHYVHAALTTVAVDTGTFFTTTCK